MHPYLIEKRFGEKQPPPRSGWEFSTLILILLIWISFRVPAGNWSAFCFLASCEKVTGKFPGAGRSRMLFC